MENNNFLNLEWVGDEKGLKGVKDPEMIILVNDKEAITQPYKAPCSLRIPITGDSITIKVYVGKSEKTKKGCFFKGTFQINPGKDYYCRLFGQASSFEMLKLKFSKEDTPVADSDHVCRNNIPVGILSFCFPIYGIINMISSKYNRTVAFVGTGIGFVLATFVSLLAKGDNGMVAIGVGRTALFEYEPFSITDIIINLLIGGISSLRGILTMLLENIVS